MRNHSALGFFASAALLFACGSDDPAGSESPPPAAPSAQALPSAPNAPAEQAPHKQDVRARMVSVERVPVPDQRLVLIDQSGARREATSDIDGIVRFDGVIAPYDLAVEPTAGTTQAPRYFLDLDRADPEIMLGVGFGTPPDPTTVQVTLHLPACGAPPCAVQVQANGPGISGSTSMSYNAGQTQAVVEMSVQFNRDYKPGRSATLSALTYDQPHAQFAHAVVGISPTPGTTARATLSPISVGATAPVMLSLEDSGHPAAWSRQIQSSVKLPSGAHFSLFTVQSPSLVMRYPNILGAQIHAYGTVRAPIDRDTPRWQRGMSQAWVAPQPTSVSSITLKATRAVQATAPVEGGSISRASVVRWKRAAPGITTLQIGDILSERRMFEVYTDGLEVSFARLERLGMPRLPTGKYSLELLAQASSIEEVFAPDWDWARPYAKAGVNGDQGFSFDLTE